MLGYFLYTVLWEYIVRNIETELFNQENVLNVTCCMQSPLTWMRNPQIWDSSSSERDIVCNRYTKYYLINHRF